MIVLLGLIALIWVLDDQFDGIAFALEEVESEHGKYAAFNAAMWILTW